MLRAAVHACPGAGMRESAVQYHLSGSVSVESGLQLLAKVQLVTALDVRDCCVACYPPCYPPC